MADLVLARKASLLCRDLYSKEQPFGDGALQAFLDFQQETEALRAHVAQIFTLSPHISPKKQASHNCQDDDTHDQGAIASWLPSAPEAPFHQRHTTAPNQQPTSEVTNTATRLRDRHLQCVSALLDEPYWAAAVPPPQRPLHFLKAGNGCGCSSGLAGDQRPHTASATAGRAYINDCCMSNSQSALEQLPVAMQWSLDLPKMGSSSLGAFQLR